MKANSKNLSAASTNSYVVWVSNYYRERSNGEEIRTILIGDVFHVYSVEYNKEDKKFSIKLLHYFSKEYGKEAKPVKGNKQFITQEYEHGKGIVHELRGGYQESEFDFTKSNLDTLVEKALELI